MAQAVLREERRSESARRVAASKGERATPKLAAVAPRARVRRVTPLAMLVTSAVVAVSFAAMFTQISLINRQQQLDALRHQISETQNANKELRQRESSLQSPAEILRIARDDLHMVESKPAALVTPEPEIVGVLAFPPASDSTVAPAE